MPSQSDVGNRGDTRTPQSASALVEALRTNHVEAKCRVLAQLQQLGPALSEAVPSILEALNDPAEAILWQSNGWDPPEEWFYYVRYAAVLALYSIAPEHMSAARRVMSELEGKPLHNHCNIAPFPADQVIKFPKDMWEAAGQTDTT